VIALEALGDLRERDVWGLRHERKDGLRQRFDTMAFVAALRPGLDRPGSRRHNLCHLIAADAAMPKRSAAARRLMPASMASTTRKRRSMESGFVMAASLLAGHHLESEFAALGNPQTIPLGRKTL
jgi:hypothetical protein